MPRTSPKPAAPPLPFKWKEVEADMGYNHHHAVRMKSWVFIVYHSIWGRCWKIKTRLPGLKSDLDYEFSDCEPAKEQCLELWKFWLTLMNLQEVPDAKNNKPS